MGGRDYTPVTLNLPTLPQHHTLKLQTLSTIDSLLMAGVLRNLCYLNFFFFLFILFCGHALRGTDFDRRCAKGSCQGSCQKRDAERDYYFAAGGLQQLHWIALLEHPGGVHVV